MGTPTQHFKTGWNDTADGILRWGDSDNSDKWPDALAWSNHCRDIAIDILKKPLESHIEFYYRGIVQAAACYEKSQEIEKL